MEKLVFVDTDGMEETYRVKNRHDIIYVAHDKITEEWGVKYLNGSMWPEWFSTKEAMLVSIENTKRRTPELVSFKFGPRIPTDEEYLYYSLNSEIVDSYDPFEILDMMEV